MSKKRKPKTYNLKSKITSALRRIWFYSPMRRECEKRLKDNGNRCELCNVQHDKLDIDHISPVVPTLGFDNWQNYIERLFCDSNGLRGLCKSCHKSITDINRNIRKLNNEETKKTNKPKRIKYRRVIKSIRTKRIKRKLKN